jgi:hypothetical protein
MYITAVMPRQLSLLSAGSPTPNVASFVNVSGDTAYFAIPSPSSGFAFSRLAFFVTGVVVLDFFDVIKHLLGFVEQFLIDLVHECESFTGFG